MAYKVLIVDDSSLVRKVLKKTFGMTTIDVEEFYEAANGKEALTVLEDHSVDLVFLDVNMPVMNGMEFMTVVRNSPKWLKLPVIVFSTEGSEERIEELLWSGVQAYLRKPATPEQLMETVEKVLEAGK